MDDLKTALRTYVEQTIERVNVDDLAHADAEPPRQSPVWWKRPVAVAAFSAASMIVLVVGTVIVMNSLNTDPIAPATDTLSITVAPPPATAAPSTSTAVSTTTATADTTPSSAPEIEWTAAVVESPDNASIASVVAIEDLLVAVGERTEIATQDEYPADAAVWISTDGEYWEAVEDPSFAGADEGPSDRLGSWVRAQGMWDVAAGPLGVIAIGSDRTSGSVWISPDGRSWTQVVDPRWSVKPAALSAVTAGGPGWVAVGDDGQGNGWVWLSADGLAWSVIELATFGYSEYAGHVGLNDVINHDGLLVAAGSIDFATGDRDAIWVSEDGITWELVLPAGGPVLLSRNETLGSLVGFGDSPAIPLLSEDGIVWTPGSPPSPPPSAHAAFIDDWGLAAGRDLAASVWFSGDGGSSWMRTLPTTPQSEDESWTSDVVAIDDRMVVVGTRPGVLARAGWGNAAGSTAVAWIAERKG